MKRFLGIGLVMLGLIGLGTSCYGPFKLTTSFHEWNGEVDGKWGNEAVFFVTMPVYGLAILGDAIIFNSIEFWGGSSDLGSM